MRRHALIAAAALAASTATARAASPQLFMHILGMGKMPCVSADAGTACALPAAYAVLLPHIAGAQLSLPWSAVQTTSASTYDWTRVENVIRPWVDAGKQVAVSFHAVEENAGVDRTGIPATPAFILAPPAGHGPRIVQCKLQSGGTSYTPPAVPVYWDPAYTGPWHAFGAAAIRHFAGRPEIAYLRFGEGEGDESMVEVTKLPGTGKATSTSISACNTLWNQADAAVGKHGVFADHLAQAKATVSAMAAAATTTPGARPLFGSYNDLGAFQKGQSPAPHPFADQLAAAEAAAGMAPGNEGFGDPNGVTAGDQTGGFSGIYGWTDPWFATVHAARPASMYMQTSSPQLLGNYAKLPTLLQAAMSYHIGTFEMYAADLFAMFDPNNVSGDNPYTGTSPSRTCLSAQVNAVLTASPKPSCH